MSRPLLLCLLALTAFVGRGEYNGYHLTLQVQTREGAELTGYIYVSEYDLDLDSLGSTDHLLLVLDQSQLQGGPSDSIAFFLHRIRYTYRMVGDSAGEMHAIHHLSERITLLKSAIAFVRVTEYIEESRLSDISSTLSPKDSAWMYQPPVRSAAFGAYLCSHQIFVHTESDTTRAVLARLARMQARIDSLEVDHENGDALDEEVWQLLQELQGEKVVVVSECTC